MNHFHGVIPGLVQSLEDPQGMGRIQVSFPRMPGENRSFWASVATPMAGKDRGFFFQPEKYDEVLVAFEEGEAAHPYIVGFLWNGVDTPPPGLNSSSASVRRLRTVSGHVLEFDDRSGQEEIHLKTQGGQEIELKDVTAAVSIKTKGGQKITLEDSPAGKIQVSTSGSLKLTLSDLDQSIKLEGGGRTLLMHAGQLQIT